MTRTSNSEGSSLRVRPKDNSTNIQGILLDYKPFSTLTIQGDTPTTINSNPQPAGTNLHMCLLLIKDGTEEYRIKMPFLEVPNLKIGESVKYTTSYQTQTFGRQHRLNINQRLYGTSPDGTSAQYQFGKLKPQELTPYHQELLTRNRRF